MESETATYLVLGPVTVVDGSGAPLAIGGAQRRALLAQLVLAPGRVVSVDSLVEGLWGDRPPPTAVKSIQIHVSRLRRVLAPGALATRAPGYLLDVPGHATDVARFEAVSARARGELDAGRAEAAADLFRSALGLWRGQALADVADHPFAAAAIARLEEARGQAIEARVAADLLLGRHATLVGELEALVRAEPLRERLWAHLMTALYRCDRQAEALDAFTRARRHLVEELGLEPGEELRRVERSILEQRMPTVPAPVAPVATGSGTTTAPARRARPSRDDRHPTGPIVGRRAPLALLDAALTGVTTGGPAVVGVRGDEGLGKTTLMAAFAGSAGERALVLAGRCREHVAVPFAPWAEVLGQLGSEDVLGLLESDTAAETPERRRARVFEAVVSDLHATSLEQPVVVLLDDLQWSDDASVTLLQYAIDELSTSAVLFVLAWRGREVSVGHPLTRLVHQVARERFPIADLGPLDVGDIAELLTLADASADPSRLHTVASLIETSTSGVPLFVADLVSTLGADHHQLPHPDDIAPVAPETARTLVARRLTLAGPRAAAVAEACAVLTDPFPAGQVHALVAEVDVDEVLLTLDGLVAAGLLREGPLGYVFEHDTFRQAVDSSMRSGRRQTLHAGAFRVLARESAPPAVLVHHAEAAGALVPAGDVLRLLERAGTDAVGRGAFTDAAGFFGRAADRTVGAERSLMLMALADALWRAGDITAAKAAHAEVVALAGDPCIDDGVLVDAVVRHGTFGAGYGIDASSISAVEAALAVVSDPGERARLHVAAAYHHATWGSPLPLALKTLEQATAALTDPCPPALASEALFAEGQVLLGTPQLERRKQVADDLYDIGLRTGSLRYIGRALQLRALVEMSAGRLDDVETTLGELLEVADRTASWFYRAEAWRWQVAVSLATGDLDRAEAGIDEMVRVGEKPLADVVVGRMLLHRARGELDACLALVDGLRAVFPAARAEAPDRPLTDLFRLVVLAEMGEIDEARDEFVRLAPHRDLDEAASRQYPGELALCAQLAARFRLVEPAQVLRQRIEPFRGQLLILAWGEGVLGAADRFLAQLGSVVNGRVDAGSFQAAVDLEEGAGATAEAQRTRDAWRRTDSAVSADGAR